MIRPVSNADAIAIARIYNHYIATTTISFETEPVTNADMTERIAEVAAAELP